MSRRPALTAIALGAVVLVLGGLLAGRLTPGAGSSGPVEPVVISPAGLTVTSEATTAPTADVTPSTPAPSRTTAPPRVEPSAPVATTPTRVLPKPQPLDDDDDDDADDDDLEDDDRD